jgi:L-erythrulose 1-phosphate isomerase
MAEGYAEALARYDWNQFANIVPFVLPPFPFVQTVAARLTGTAVRVGVQNVHWSADGPFTGEALSTMAFEIGARLAEIGHAEHHALFGDTEEIIREKTRLAVAAGLSASVNHKLEQAAGTTMEIRQAKIALSGPAHCAVENCILAYEPIQSIGSVGTSADPSGGRDDLARPAGRTGRHLGRRRRIDTSALWR